MLSGYTASLLNWFHCIWSTLDSQNYNPISKPGAEGCADFKCMWIHERQGPSLNDEIKIIACQCISKFRFIWQVNAIILKQIKGTDMLPGTMASSLSEHMDNLLHTRHCWYWVFNISKHSFLLMTIIRYIYNGTIFYWVPVNFIDGNRHLVSKSIRRSIFSCEHSCFDDKK